jgi:arylsulfatase A
LIGSVDFLPTLCAVAKTEVPSALRIDGLSFLPQIFGEKGRPRECLYTWYVRDGGPRATYEFAMSTEYKLYRDGTFFDLTADPFEEKPMKAASLSGAPAEAARRLQAELDHYRNVRPAHLMSMPDTSKNVRGVPGGGAGKKKKS